MFGSLKNENLILVLIYLQQTEIGSPVVYLGSLYLYTEIYSKVKGQICSFMFWGITS